MSGRGRGIESEDAGEDADEEQDPDAAGEIAADVGAKRRATDGEGDQAHDLAEHGPRVVAGIRPAWSEPETVISRHWYLLGPVTWELGQIAANTSPRESTDPEG